MASVATVVGERRKDPRVEGGGHSFQSSAVLRPGQEVTLVNISRRGALIDSGVRLRPGAQAELLLCGTDVRVRVEGRLHRCHVVRLDPVRYRGVVVFDQDVEIGDGC